MKQQDIYQTVTNDIIQLLENHIAEGWEKPWIAMGVYNSPATNATTGKAYRGINQFLLGIQLAHKKYQKNQWLTFKQAKDLKAKVKKGEKSSLIVFTKPIYVTTDKTFIPLDKIGNLTLEQQKEKELKKIFMLKLYRVFNVAQTEGLAPDFYHVEPQKPLPEFEKNDRAEKLIFSTDATIEITERNEAFYDPTLDKIQLPLREQFKSTEPFYATALHELGHWTGHPSRLNRDIKHKFGEVSYAKEELVAELTSAFLCATLGFEKTITQNAAYIKGWLGALKKDNKAIFKAAQRAQKAADYILTFKA